MIDFSGLFISNFWFSLRKRLLTLKLFSVFFSRNFHC